MKIVEKYNFFFVIFCFFFFNSYLLAQTSPAPLPDSLNFAGERTPLEEAEIRERLGRELDQNMYKHSATLLILKRQARWQDTVKTILKQEGVPEDFFYLAVSESELDEYAVSAKDAMGFWQFLAPTARELGLEVSEYVDERKDIYLSTQAACRYFKKAYAMFGSWTSVAVSYNRGMFGLKKSIEAQQVTDYYDLYFGRESYRYVFRILAMKLILQNPERYGFEIPANDLYAPFRFKTVDLQGLIQNVGLWAKEQKTSFRILKLYNPWLEHKDGKWIGKVGKTYQIRLPL